MVIFITVFNAKMPEGFEGHVLSMMVFRSWLIPAQIIWDSLNFFMTLWTVDIEIPKFYYLTIYLHSWQPMTVA